MGRSKHAGLDRYCPFSAMRGLQEETEETQEVKAKQISIFSQKKSFAVICFHLNINNMDHPLYLLLLVG